MEQSVVEHFFLFGGGEQNKIEYRKKLGSEEDTRDKMTCILSYKWF